MFLAGVGMFLSLFFRCHTDQPPNYSKHGLFAKCLNGRVSPFFTYLAGLEKHFGMLLPGKQSRGLLTKQPENGVLVCFGQRQPSIEASLPLKKEIWQTFSPARGVRARRGVHISIVLDYCPLNCYPYSDDI